MLQEFLVKLEQLVNIDSWSHDPVGVSAVADVIEGWYRDLGWRVQRHDVGAGAGPVLEISNRGNERFDAVFLGHMDTVFRPGTVAQRPFRVEGDRAYGPGVSDMKAGLVAMYFIAKALSADPENAPAVCMLCNPDEEIGSRSSMEKMCEITARSSRLYVLESPGDQADLHCYARRGIRPVEVVFRGQSAHAGNILETPGASAILEAARWTEFFCGLVDREKGITANVGVIEGGLATNVVPDYAKIRAEVRTDTPEDMNVVMEKIRQRAANPVTLGVTVEVTVGAGRPPLVPSAGTMAEIRRAESVAASLGQSFRVEKCGGVTDANNLCAALPELICLDDMGPAGGGFHAPQEYLELASVEPCVALLTALVKELKSS